MFEFLADHGYSSVDISRLNLRHKMVLMPYADMINGANVLDLASHDGRWPYAFAATGAKHVIGIEGRKNLVEKFLDFPDPNICSKVDMRCGDIFDGCQELIEQGQTFDVIGVLGIYYHIMDHYRLLLLLQRLKPKLVLIDSEFMTGNWPYIAIVQERTDKDLNTTAYIEGQFKAPIGIPSKRAMEVMADSLGYNVDWCDWDKLPESGRTGVNDYYRPGSKRRMSCALKAK